MPRVDFVITNPRHHLAMFGPVIGRLQEAGVRCRVLSLCELRGYHTPAQEFTDLGVEWKRLMPVRLSKDSRQLRAVRDRAAGRTREWLHHAVWRAFIHWHRRLAGQHPDLTVVPNDTAFPYDRIVEELREDAIPFVLMQEGVRFELPGWTGRGQYGQGGAAAVAAWGQASVGYFRSVGVPAERIHVVGNPRLDGIRARDWSEPARTLQRSLDVPGQALVLFTNPIDLQGFCSSHDKYRLVETFLREAASLLDARGLPVVVKIHPSESLPAYRAIIGGTPVRARVVRDANPYALLQFAAGVVVLGSTVGLEAMLFDRPVGVMEVPEAGYLYDFVEYGAAVGLQSGASLSDQLTDLLADGPVRRLARQRYLREQIANLGRSVDAAAGLIRNLVEHRTAVLR